MPELASSRAIGSVIPTTPPLDAEYATWPTWPSNAATEAVMMITPRSPSAFGVFCCMAAAAWAAHQQRADEIDFDDLAEEVAGHRAVLADELARRADAGAVDGGREPAHRAQSLRRRRPSTACSDVTSTR